MNNDTIKGFIFYFVIAVALTIYLFNRLVMKRNRIDAAYGAVDAMLKQRFDLDLFAKPDVFFSYKKIYDELALIIGTVEALNLNKQLWGRPKE